MRESNIPLVPELNGLERIKKQKYYHPIKVNIPAFLAVK